MFLSNLSSVPSALCVYGHCVFSPHRPLCGWGDVAEGPGPGSCSLGAVELSSELRPCPGKHVQTTTVRKT